MAVTITRFPLLNENLRLRKKPGTESNNYGQLRAMQLRAIDGVFSRMFGKLLSYIGNTDLIVSFKFDLSSSQ